MLRFSLKDILRGTTLIAIGCGMLAIASHGAVLASAEANSLPHAFLVAFGGLLIGYGVAFPLKWPPHQMISGLIGMIAAQAWQTGSRIGLIVFVGLLAVANFPPLVSKIISKMNRSNEPD